MSYKAQPGQWLLAERYSDTQIERFDIPHILDGVLIAQERREQITNGVYPTYHFFDDKGSERIFPKNFVENFDWQLSGMGEK